LEDLRERLRAHLARHCRDSHEVDDVIQETFVRAALYRKRLSDVRRLEPWAVRIAFNVLTDGRRRASRCTTTTTPGLLEGVEARESRREADEAIREGEYRIGPWTLDHESALTQLSAALGALREEDRRMLAAFYGGAGSCREAGAACGVPLHRVKVRLFRARRKLLRLLRKRFALAAAPGLVAEERA
jgi:RNA polymerase sigma factor (sigma-70 family)